MEQLSFKQLPLSQSLTDNLDNLGFESMTPIQAESLPAILDGKDVLAKAKTGSGKTVAFSLGLLAMQSGFARPTCELLRGRSSMRLFITLRY